MLFELNCSLAHAIRDNAPHSEVLIEVVEKVAHSRREGKHIVFAGRETLKFFSECLELSIIARNVYRKLYGQLPQLKAYLDNIGEHVEIIATPGIMHKNGTIIQLSANYFTNLSLVNETILLAENLGDAQFYKKIAQVYLADSKKGNIDINLEPRCGGGSTTADEYESIQDNGNRFCLCIADSDKNFPDAPEGDTLSRLREFDNADNLLCRLFGLPVKNVENLIPTQSYLEISELDANRMSIIAFLELLDESAVVDARKFYNFKKGIKIKDLIHDPQDHRFVEYWQDILITLGRSVVPRPECTSCNTCEDQNCYIVPSFGDNVFTQVRENVFEKKSNHKIAEMVSETLKPTWNELGALITSWCCAAPRLATT